MTLSEDSDDSSDSDTDASSALASVAAAVAAAATSKRKRGGLGSLQQHVQKAALLKQITALHHLPAPQAARALGASITKFRSLW